MRQKNRRIALSEIILTIFAVGQIVCTIVFYKKGGSILIRNAGWIILWISAIFGWLPIFTFKKWGGVQKGKSYIKTTQFVDRGVYAIVRHPQYLAGILISISLTLIAQHWIVFIPGIVCIYIYYFDTFKEEEFAIEKFGEQYKAYQKGVPRLNFIAGIIRIFTEKARKS